MSSREFEPALATYQREFWDEEESAVSSSRKGRMKWISLMIILGVVLVVGLAGGGSSVMNRSFGEAVESKNAVLSGQNVKVGAAYTPPNCADGEYLASQKCHPCPGGYFCKGNKKTICPAGSYQPKTGQKMCIPAACGHFVPAPGATMQQECRAGTFSGVGSVQCTPTPVGTYTGAGACKPIPCPKGQYQDCDGQSNCQKGPCGHFVAKTGQTGFTPCPAGTYQPAGGQSSCLPVGPGQYSGVGHCKPRVCIPGYYQDLPGQKSCKPADCGKKVPNPGSNNQVSCGKGYYQPQPGQPSCLAIPAGYVSDKGGCAIVCCPAGKFRNSNFVCEPAPCGSFVPNKCASAPTKCPAGEYTSGPGASSCTKAPPGSIPKPNQCGTDKCPPGQYQNQAGQTKCKDAQCGYKAPNHGTVNPVPCPMGYFQDAVKSTTCKPCAAGSANNKVAQCHCPLCSKGHYQPNTGKKSCIPSPCGNFVPGKGATKVNPCPPGEYQDKTGQSACIKAPAGKYAVGGTCQPGTCPPGTFTPTAGLTKCTDAPCGSFVGMAGATSATPCVAGEYQPLPGQTKCLATPTGSYTDAPGQCQEKLCKPGQYQPQTGQKNCLPAKCGHYVAITGSAVQNQCGPGRYQPLTGQTSCKQADLGHFVSGNTACKQDRCPEGSYTDCKGQSMCILAPCGHFVSGTGKKAVTPCPAGTYQNTPGQASCKTTPAGSFSGVGYCFAQACDPGTYQPSAQKSSCKAASCGHFVDGEGRKSQSACVPGSYQPKTGQVGCLLTTLLLAPNQGTCNINGANSGTCPKSFVFPKLGWTYEPKTILSPTTAVDCFSGKSLKLVAIPSTAQIMNAAVQAQVQTTGAYAGAPVPAGFPAMKTSYTFFARVKASPTHSGWTHVFGRNNGGNSGLRTNLWLRLGSTFRLDFDCNGCGNSFRGCEFNVPRNLGVVTLGGVYDDAAKHARLYWNGAHVHTCAWSGGIKTGPLNPLPWHVGGASWDSRNFRGNIYDVYYFDRALSTGEMKTLSGCAFSCGA